MKSYPEEIPALSANITNEESQQIIEQTNQWSDYDLAVFVEGTESWKMTDLARLCATIQQEAGDDIELHFFPADQAAVPDPASFAAYVIKHGIRLTFAECAA